jgi:hypothetical protein
MKTNDATAWEQALAGKPIPLTTEMEPDYGFYRVPTKDKTSFRAMSYYYENGKLFCLLDGRPLDEQRAREIWSWASQRPITYELYKAVVEDGQPWPDLNSIVTRSNSAPDDNSFEAIQERIDDLAREAERLMKKGAAKTQEEADQAADVANKLGQYWKKADDLRKVEKRPWDDKAAEVQEKFRPSLTAASVYTTLKQIVVAPWLAKQKREKEAAEAEARRIADAALALARQAEADARRAADDAARTGDMAAVAEAGLAAKKAEEVSNVAAAAQQTVQHIATSTVTAGTRGRGVHLRSEPVYTIENRDAMFGYLKGNDRALLEIDTVMLSHAKRLHKAGVPVPGLKIDSGSQAA